MLGSHGYVKPLSLDYRMDLRSSFSLPFFFQLDFFQINFTIVWFILIVELVVYVIPFVRSVSSCDLAMLMPNTVGACLRSHMVSITMLPFLPITLPLTC